MQQLTAGTTLQGGKYRLIRVLGQGGFGITYLAYHTMLDKMVAIKEFFPKEYCDRDETTSHVAIGFRNAKDLVNSLKSKFLKEAKNISKLDHPGIVRIYDVFEENDTAYYIMEYIEGISLSAQIKQKRQMSQSEAIVLIKKIASALKHIHSLSMNHLDIKPANIMIRAKDGEPVLIDFGLSKQYDASGSQTSTTPVGISHGYAPIEQYLPGGVSSFSPQTDIYALGATFYAMITGSTPPHYGDILENGIPEYLIEVDSNIKEAIEHALETKKQKRPQSIDEFIEHFDNVEVSNLSANKQKTNDVIPLSIELKGSEKIISEIDNYNIEASPQSESIAEDFELSKEETLLVPTVGTIDHLVGENDKDAVDSITKPKIIITKRRGMNNINRTEYVEVSWDISDANSAYLISNEGSKRIPLKGKTTITKLLDHILIRARGENDENSESCSISFY